jgi:phosphoglycolate phosphatase
MRGVTLVFDLDGTLVDTAPDLIASTNHALLDLGLAPVSPELLRPAIGFGARHMIVEGLKQTGLSLEGPELDRLLARFLHYYEANIAVDSRPFEGAVRALETFRDAGARLAVCTNKRESLSRSLLAALGLDKHFAALAGRDTFAVHKPDPGHLTGTIKLANGDSRRAIMIGDSRVDVDTAKAAYLPVIACSFGYSDLPVRDLGADAVIGHFDELETAVARIVPLLPPAAAETAGA